MNAQDLSTLFRLRLLVGYLGERAQFGWWPSGFFESSSHLFLDPAFPRTSRLAQYHAVVEAARRLHDEHLNLGSFHLFRLPEEAEQDLHTLASSPKCEQVVAEHLQNRETALAALQAMAEGKQAMTPGPMLLGRIDGTSHHVLLAAMAGAYWAAFNGDSRTYPYFAS